jgi:transposase-like protein
MPQDKPKRRSYTPEQRQTAMDTARAHGVPYAARDSGIPRGTISKWLQRAGLSVSAERRDALAARHQVASMAWAARRAELADSIGGTAELAHTKAVDCLQRGDLHNARMAALVMATMVDKAQLLTGGATTRPDLGGDKLRDEADEILRRLESMEGGPA